MLIDTLLIELFPELNGKLASMDALSFEWKDDLKDGWISIRRNGVFVYICMYIK